MNDLIVIRERERGLGLINDMGFFFCGWGCGKVMGAGFGVQV